MAKDDNTPTWLQEVKLAAQYNFLRHKREQEENQRAAVAKRSGTLQELVDEELRLAKGETTKPTKNEVKEGK